MSLDFAYNNTIHNIFIHRIFCVLTVSICDLWFQDFHFIIFSDDYTYKTLFNMIVFQIFFAVSVFQVQGQFVWQIFLHNVISFLWEKISF